MVSCFWWCITNNRLSS